MLKKVGDITWHYHAGIRTYPMKLAVEKKIPLVIWGEHGFSQLTGLVSINEFVEYTKWSRLEHDMRGIEAEDLIGNDGITINDIYPYRYPKQSDVMSTDLRGIYLGNFVEWDYKKNTNLVFKNTEFNSVRYKRDRTFNLFSKIEDHANDVHDYLKYLKFGYGRATDDSSQEIRFGRLTRKEGVELVEEYDHVEPSSLDYYCDILKIKKKKFYEIVDKQRDNKIWKKYNGKWKKKTNISIYSKKNKSEIEKAKIKIHRDHIFNKANRNLWYNPKYPPTKTGNASYDYPTLKFDVV